jgi:hypothetical protein
VRHAGRFQGLNEGDASCAVGSGRGGAGAGGAFWGKIVAIVPPRGNIPAGVAADAPGGLHLGKTGFDMVMTVIVSVIIALVVVLVLGSVFGSF